MRIVIPLELVHSDPTKYKRWLVQPMPGALCMAMDVPDSEWVGTDEMGGTVLTLDGLFYVQKQLAEHSMRLETEIMKEDD
jgi:hypothetical protein